MGLLVLFFANFAVCHAVSAASSTLSLSVTSTSETLDLVPAISESAFGKSGSIIASVETDHYTGYNISIAGADDAQKLASETSELTSIAGETSPETFKTGAPEDYDNRWGFLPSRYCSGNTADTCNDNANYHPGPKNSTPTKIDVTTTKTSEPANYALAIGARVNKTAKQETYSADFSIIVLANAVNYNISYVDSSDYMPKQDSGSTTNSTTKLSNQTPVKPGYVFQGWCAVDPLQNDNICPEDKTYAKGADFPLTQTEGNSINVYAIWKPVLSFETAFENAGKSKMNVPGQGSFYKMQDMESTICEQATGIGEAGRIRLVDIRDNNIYTIAKLIDGHCWLLDNLRLTDAAGDLSYENTNVPSDWSGFPDDNSKRLPTAEESTQKFMNTDAAFSYPGIYTGALGQSNTGNVIVPAETEWDYGVLYNYNAASAGTIRYAFNGANGVYDICPKGWRIPIGGPDGEYQELYIALGGENVYNSSDTNYNTESHSLVSAYELRLTLHLPLSGIRSNNSVFIGSDGYFWGSNDNGTRQFMYSLQVSPNDGVRPLHGVARHNGVSVRCIAK